MLIRELPKPVPEYFGKSLLIPKVLSKVSKIQTTILKELVSLKTSVLLFQKTYGVKPSIQSRSRSKMTVGSNRRWSFDAGVLTVLLYCIITVLLYSMFICCKVIIN